MKTAIDLPAVAALVVICGSWGLNQVAIKVTLWGIPPAMQMGARSLLGGMLVLLWCLLRKKPVFASDGTLWLGIAAGLCFGVEFVLIFWGVQFTTASRAAIFVNLAPFVVALLGHFVLGEKLSPGKIAGLAAAFSGVVLAFSEGLSLPSPNALWGDALCIGGAILWGVTTVLIKGSALRHIEAEKTLLYQLGVSGVLGLTLSLALGETVDPDLAIAVLPAFLYQAVWVAGVTYVGWFMLIRAYPASLLSSFTFLTPLFGVAFGHALLDEPVGVKLIGALLLVAGGLYLVNRSGRPVPAPA